MQVTPVVQNINNNSPSFGRFIFTKHTLNVANREFKTPEMKDIFRKIVSSQNSNHVNIILDYDLIDLDEPYLKTQVGRFSLSQWHPHLCIKENPITFLKRTTILANLCKILNLHN